MSRGSLLGQSMTLAGLGSRALDLAVIGNCRTAALGEHGRTPAVVVLSALRFRSGILAPAGRRRGEGLLRRRRGGGGLLRGELPAQHRDRADHHSRCRRATPCRSRTSRRASCAIERVFNPAQIFRRIEPLAGLPRIKIRVRPTFNYGGEPTSRAIGSNHMRFTGGVDTLRVTTDAATHLPRARDVVRRSSSRSRSFWGPMNRSKRPSNRPRASSWSGPRTTGSTGCARWPFRWSTRPR